MSKWLVTRYWVVDAATAADALDLAKPGEQRASDADRVPFEEEDAAERWVDRFLRTRE